MHIPGVGGVIGGGEMHSVLDCSDMAKPAHSKLLGVFKGIPWRTLLVAMHITTSFTRVLSSSGRIARSCATAPATCDAAIDVPDKVSTLESTLLHADVMWDPGANMSTQGP